jgi:hypothetical protein
MLVIEFAILSHGEYSSRYTGLMPTCCERNTGNLSRSTLIQFFKINLRGVNFETYGAHQSA